MEGNEAMKYRRFTFALLLFAVTSMESAKAMPQETLTVWDYDHIARQALPEWRYLAVDSVDNPVPTVDWKRLAVVKLPWQLERPRPMAYWLQKVTVPERFDGREVVLVVESRGPTRVVVNGTQVAERKGGDEGTLRVPIQQGKATDVAIAVQHGDQPGQLIAARLEAEPHGFNDYIARRSAVVRSIPIPSADAADVPWRVKVKAPDTVAQPDFDDSAWETGGKDFHWPDQHTECWYRAKLTVPTEMGGIPTEGKALHLRGSMDDEGRVFVNGVELKQAPAPSNGTAFAIPANVKPGDEVLVALRILNKWGDGRLRWLQWRFADMDSAELDLETFNKRMLGIDRVLQIHDKPGADWMPTLNHAVDLLENAQKDVVQFPKMASEALTVLDRVDAMLAKSPIIMLSPYLQDVRTDRATIMWETSAPVASHIEYGEHELTKRTDDSSQSKTIREVDLTDLKPDTTYRYRVVSGHYATDIFKLHTAPNGKRAFSFLVWGDNRSDPRMCERVCLQMTKADADLVLNVGDVVGRGSEWNQWTEQYLIPVRHWSYKWPSYVAIGNHEYGGSEGPSVPAFEQYVAHPTLVPGSNEYWYSFDYSNAHFLFIDGNRFDIVDPTLPEKDWVISPDDPQFKWIQEDLKNAEGRYDWIFAFIHEPPYSEGWSGGYYDGEPPLRTSLVPLLETHGVDILFAGHTHDYERGLPHPPFNAETHEGNNTAYIITGGGGASLDNHKYYEWGQIDIPDHPAVADSDEPDEGEYYRYHYIHVAVDGKKLSFEAREVLPNGRDGGVFDDFRLEK